MNINAEPFIKSKLKENLTEIDDRQDEDFNSFFQLFSDSIS